MRLGGTISGWGGAFVGLVTLASGCGGSSADSNSQNCAPGTHLEDNACVVTIECGPGTTPVAGACLPSGAEGGAMDEGSGIQCGLGTHLEGNRCLPLASAGSGHGGNSGASAGEGGIAGLAGEGNSAEPAAGEGGAPAGGVGGASSAVSCGPGTMQVGELCLPDEPSGSLPSFIVRVGVATVGADGYSAIPVFVVGTNPNYDPAQDSVVLGLERPGAGTLSLTAFKPGPSGTTLYFTPCSSATNSFCAGTQSVTLALASAPTEVVTKSQSFTLVTPTGVGSDSPCLGGGNTLFFNGDAGEYIYTGIQTVTLAAWSATASSSQVHISLDPSDPNQGLWWDLYFDASKLPNPVLTTQVYEGAQRWPFQDTGHPGFDVSGDGKGCNTVSGRFEIRDLKMNGGSLQSFTATFEHHCEGGSPALRGCVHYGQ